jgi:hypothetical protein
MEFATRSLTYFSPQAEWLGHEGHRDGDHQLQMIAQMPCVYRTLFEDLQQMLEARYTFGRASPAPAACAGYGMPSTPKGALHCISTLYRRAPRSRNRRVGHCTSVATTQHY